MYRVNVLESIIFISSHSTVYWPTLILAHGTSDASARNDDMASKKKTKPILIKICVHFTLLLSYVFRNCNKLNFCDCPNIDVGVWFELLVVRSGFFL